MEANLIERGPQLFTDGPVTLAIGRDTAITQWEILGHMTADRVSPDSIARGIQLVEAELPAEAVGSLFIDERAGAEDFAAAPEIPARRFLIAETMAAVWRSRIQDIADASAPLYQDAVNNLGRLDISGQRLLNELLAQRRREPSAEAGEVEVLTTLVHELRQSVVFGAAGFMAADPADLKATTQQALAPDGWIHKLSLLIAAQECLAGVILTHIRTTPVSPAAAEELTRTCTFMLVNRAADRDLAEQLSETVQRLQDPQWRATNVVKKIISRATHRMLDGAVHSIGTFVKLRQGSENTFPTLELTPGTPAGSNEILDAELVPEFEPEELATILGDLFEKMLPDATAYVEKLVRDHPKDTLQQRENRARRRFSDLASGRTVDTNHGYLELDEAVALHAMTLAVLREVPVDNPAKRNRQAKQLGLAITGFSKLQDIPGNKVVQRGISMAQASLYTVIFSKVGVGKRFPRLAFALGMLERFAPTVDEKFIAEKMLFVVNGGAVRIIEMMVNRAIR